MTLTSPTSAPLLQPTFPPQDVPRNIASDAPLCWLGALLDPTTLPRGQTIQDGIVTATGLIHGFPVSAFACDPARWAGALGAPASDLIAGAVSLGLRQGWPVVGIWHSAGAKLQDGPASLEGIGRLFAALVAASGRVPLISVVLGPAAGGAAYGPALGDVVIMGPSARVFVTGPDVVQAVTGEKVDSESLGGPIPHSSRSGVAHIATPTEKDAMDAARRLVSLLAGPKVPATNLDTVPALREVLPVSPRRAYDVHGVVDLLLDSPAFAVELQGRWAPNIVTVLGHLGGATVGVIASNPIHRAGCLDGLSSDKAARFVQMCDALGVPLVVLVDVPGYLPGRTQEWDAIVRRGAKLVHAFADARVPRVTVILRKAYGGAYIAMNSKSLGASASFAWPGAEVGVMNPEAAVEILHRRELDPLEGRVRSKRLHQLGEQYQQTSGGLRSAVQSGFIDAVIEPEVTRQVIARALAGTVPRRGAHRNPPT